MTTGSGFEPGVRSPERRSLLDLRRLLTDLTARVTTAETGLAQQADRMAVLLTMSVAQSVPVSGAAHVVLFDSETFDTSNLHSTSVNTGRITVPIGGAGLWCFGYTLTYDNNTNGYRSAWMSVDGSAGHRFGVETARMTSVGEFSGSGSHIYRLSDASYLELRTVQTSGGALNILGDATATGFTSFWAYRLSD